ncbi:polysaccharide pyruvyl transferase family protein [Microbacterium lacticum]
MNSTHKHALIVGPYRAHNFGDDLVGAIIARHLQSRGYAVSIPRLGPENSAWLGSEYSETYDGQFEKADVIVVGGGGILSDTSGAKPGASYLDLVARAGMDGKLEGKKVYVTSVGAGPWILERSKMLAFAVSLISEKVGVREQESYDHLRGLGVTPRKLVLGADLALLTPKLLDFPTTMSGKLGLQFDVGSFADVQENPHLPAIIEAIEQYARNRSSDVVLIRNGRARSDLAAAAPEASRLSYSTLEAFLPRLAGLRALFTSHLHLAITSYAQRIPTFSLYAREKTRRFYEQIGHPERAIDLKTATVADFERFISSAEVATWTDEDESTLNRLQGESRKLIEFVR